MDTNTSQSWKPAPGCVGLEVGDHGMLRNEKGKVWPGYRDPKGYYRINAAGFGFSVEEVVDYFPMVKLVDGAVKRNQSPGRDRSSRWCAIWEVGSQGRFLASATMIVFLNVMKTTLPFGEFPLSRVPGQ